MMAGYVLIDDFTLYSGGPTGWRCPVCNVGVAPWVTSCLRCVSTVAPRVLPSYPGTYPTPSWLMSPIITCMASSAQ